MQWETATLDKLCEFKNGLWKGKVEPFINVGVIRNTNFAKDAKLDDTDIAFLDVEAKQYQTRKLKFGDLILEKSGGGPKQPVGRVIAFEKKEGEFSFSNFTSIIRIRDNSRLNYSYLHKFLHYLYETGVTESMQRQSTGIRNLQLNDYKLVEIPLPSIAEQKNIVDMLDKTFADIEQMRAKTEQNLENARELFESYLQQVFSQRGDRWKIKKVSDIADTCLGKMLDKKKNKGNPQPYLRNLNVQWFEINTNDLLDMRFETSEYDRYSIKKGDLVICEGGYPGRGAIWEQDEDVYFQKALHRIRAQHSIYNRWILYYLYLSNCNGSLKANFTGAGIQHFTGKSLKQLTLPVPDKELADTYIKKIDELHRQVRLLEKVYLQKLDIINELKKSILQKAFAGELSKSIA
jgi:type I restriction enzyme S subunit